MLNAQQLTLGVPGRVLLADFSWQLLPGQCWAILGGNGSGKTTLLHVLAGLRGAQGGQVALAGQALDAWSREDLARQVGVLMQDDPSGYWGSVADYVLLGRFPHGDRDVGSAARALRRLALETLAERRYASLSGGERQRVRIAQLLCQETPLCLLDEPLQHLDLRHQAAVMGLFAELAGQGRAVAMVLHEPWWARSHCTHALFLHGDGRAEAGTVAELLTPSRLSALYGCTLPVEWRA